LSFLGLGFAFFSSPNTNAIMSSIDERFYGVSYEHRFRNTALLGYFIDESVEWFFYDYVYSRVFCGHGNLRTMFQCITYGTLINNNQCLISCLAYSAGGAKGIPR
jgi:hypothetical protein